MLRYHLRILWRSWFSQPCRKRRRGTKCPKGVWKWQTWCNFRVAVSSERRRPDTGTSSQSKVSISARKHDTKHSSISLHSGRNQPRGTRCNRTLCRTDLSTPTGAKLKRTPSKTEGSKRPTVAKLVFHLLAPPPVKTLRPLSLRKWLQFSCGKLTLLAFYYYFLQLSRKLPQLDRNAAETSPLMNIHILTVVHSRKTQVSKGGNLRKAMRFQ